jgi:hypothetical protein
MENKSQRHEASDDGHIKKSDGINRRQMFAFSVAGPLLAVGESAARLVI